MELLEGLDEIDWGALQQAYGSAFEVPVWLRDLLSTEHSISENAYHELSQAINHQGSLYNSTLSALPFVIEVARLPGLPVRAGLLGLLASIGGGDDTELGESFDRSRGTRETDEEWQTYIDKRKRAREARALVAAQFSIFLEALDDPDNEVRQFATWALLVCEAQAHIIVQAIQHRFEVEPDALTKEILRDALEHFAALAEQGRCPAMSAGSLRQWLQAHPEERRPVKNPFLLRIFLSSVPPLPADRLAFDEA